MASAHVYPVYPDWLETLLEPFEDQQVALTTANSAAGKPPRSRNTRSSITGTPTHPHPRQDHPFCNNANAAIRRVLWEQHPYDESLPALEDLEWAKWAMEQGYGISYVAEAEIIHIHNQSLAGIYNRYKREAMAFKRLYPQEVFSERDLIRLFLRNVTRDFEIASAQRVLWKHWCEDHRLSLAAVLRNLPRLPSIRSAHLAVKESLLLSPGDRRIILTA